MWRRRMVRGIIKTRKIPLVSQQRRDPRSGRAKPVTSLEMTVSSGDSSRVGDCHPQGWTPYTGTAP